MASTGKAVEVDELAVDFSRAGTIVVREGGASSTGQSFRGNVVAETAEVHRSAATGDVLSPGPVQFILAHYTGLKEVHVLYEKPVTPESPPPRQHMNYIQFKNLFSVQRTRCFVPTEADWSSTWRS